MSPAELNYCTRCRKDFASLRAFDTHRVGTFAYTFRQGLDMDPPREDGRRCLDTEEMLARAAPFVQDARGRWNLVHTMGRAAEAFGTGQP